MVTYLDILPEDIFRIIFKLVNDAAIVGVIKKAKRRNLPYHGMKTNSRVVYSWMNDKPCRSLHMKTDGNVLYSYMLRIGDTDLNGDKVLLDYTAKALGYHSHTTSTHVNIARWVADVVISTSFSEIEYQNITISLSDT